MINWFFGLKLSKKIIVIFALVIVPLLLSNFSIIISQKQQSTRQLQKILQNRMMIVKSRIDEFINYQHLDIFSFLSEESNILKLCEKKDIKAFSKLQKYMIDKGYYSITLYNSKNIPLLESYFDKTSNIEIAPNIKALLKLGGINQKSEDVIFKEYGITIVTETPVVFKNKIFPVIAVKIIPWKKIKFMKKILNVEITFFNNDKAVFTTFFKKDSTRLLNRTVNSSIYNDLNDLGHYYYINENIVWGNYYSLFKCLYKNYSKKKMNRGIVSVSINKQFVYDNINFLRKIVYGSTFIVFILILIAAYFLSRSITNPIFKLVNGINEVMLGDFDVEIEVPNHDEIGILSEKFNHMTIQLKERDKMKQYISKSLLREIQMGASIGGNYSDSGVKRSLKTVLFTDIRNFTKISEMISPEELISVLTIFYSNVTESVENQKGTVDKFIGDSVMAVFHKEEGENTSLRAVLTALELKGRLSQLRSKTLMNNNIQLEIGIGISTGYVIEGSIGTKSFKDYTIVGDTVNLASRLENLSQNGVHSGIYIDEDTYEKIKDVIFAQSHEQIKIKGKTSLLNVYEVVCLKNREELMSSFMSDDINDIESAIIAVGISGNIEYLDRILSFLKHSVSRIRIAAVSSVLYLYNRFHKFDKDEKVCEKISLFLVGALFRETDSFVKSKLIKTLGILGGIPAIKNLTCFFSDSDARVRANSVELFSMVDDEELIKKYLFPLLDDENHRVKGNTAQILWKKGFQKVTSKKLYQMIESDDWRECASAIYSIGEIWDTKNYSQIVRLYLRGKIEIGIEAEEFFKMNKIVINALNHKNFNVVKQSIIALGKIGDRNCVIPILKILNKENYNELKPFIYKTFDTIGVSVEDMELIKMKFESYKL